MGARRRLMMALRGRVLKIAVKRSSVQPDDTTLQGVARRISVWVNWYLA
jgi:hypothetical protein